MITMGSCILMFDSQSRVLLGQRKGGYKAGTYGVPGGRVEGEELLEEAAKRELLEETGAVAKSLEYLGLVRELQDNGTFIHFIYTCINYAEEPTNLEPDKCVGWEWYDLDRLPDNILPGHYWA